MELLSVLVAIAARCQVVDGAIRIEDVRALEEGPDIFIEEQLVEEVVEAVAATEHVMRGSRQSCAHPVALRYGLAGGLMPRKILAQSRQQIARDDLIEDNDAARGYFILETGNGRFHDSVQSPLLSAIDRY